MGIRRKKTLIEQASDYVDQVRPHVEQAVADARDKAVPLIEDARDRARPIIADGAAIAAERAAQVAELAQQKAAESRDLAAAKVAEIKGEKPKKRSKLKKFVLFSGLAAGAAFVAAKLKGGRDSANWNTSYTPAPAPAPSAAPTPAAPQAGVEADDPAGSSPDEALADAAESPHDVTTPDQPADEVVIDDKEGGAHRA
jgi:vacuolar-type H+-ATPase subunit H